MSHYILHHFNGRKFYHVATSLHNLNTDTDVQVIIIHVWFIEKRTDL